MKSFIKRDEKMKNEVSPKKSALATDCLHQAAAWLGHYSQILENLQVASSAR
jgi:hypothetical protein